MKKKKKWPIVLAVLLVLVAAAIFLAPGIAYSYAQEQFAAENYDMAAQIFQILGEYEDSPAMLTKIQIRQHMAVGNYSIAEELLLTLEDSEETQAQLQECRYQRAVSYLTYGSNVNHDRINEAHAIFTDLGDYRDSADYLTQFQWALLYTERTMTASGNIMDKEGRWYNAKGQLTGQGTEHDVYTYDDAGRLASDGEYSYEYDEEGRVILKTNDRVDIDITYDKTGREATRFYAYKTKNGYQDYKPRSESHKYRYKTKYDGELLLEETLYDNNVLWSYNTYTYDEQGRVVENFRQSYAGKSFSTDYTFRYTYNDDGSLLQKEQVYPNPNNSYIDTYLYGYIWTPEA